MRNSLSVLAQVPPGAAAGGRGAPARQRALGVRAGDEGRVRGSHWASCAREFLAVLGLLRSVLGPSEVGHFIGSFRGCLGRT